MNWGESEYERWFTGYFFFGTIKKTRAEQIITHPVSPLLMVYSGSKLVDVELTDIIVYICVAAALFCWKKKLRITNKRRKRVWKFTRSRYLTSLSLSQKDKAEFSYK